MTYLKQCENIPNLETASPTLGMGLMGAFSGPKFLCFQIFFNALWAGLTNPRDISDSFTENPLIPAPNDPAVYQGRKG